MKKLRFFATTLVATLIAASSVEAQTSQHMFAWTSDGTETRELVLNGNVVVSARNSGWYDETGFHSASNPNYIVGVCGVTPPPTCAGNGLQTNNFFVFAIPAGLQVNSATLRLYNPGADPNNLGYVSPNATETYSLFSVGTSVLDLTSNQAGRVDIFNDLGSGEQFGQRVVSAADNNTLVEIALNANALGSIGLSAGQQWAIGGTLFAQAVVPEPSTYAMMIIGLAGIGLAARRRRA